MKNFERALLVLVLVAFAAACGDDDVDGNGNVEPEETTTDMPDMGNAEVDMGGPGTTAVPPAWVEMSVTPGEPVYATGMNLGIGVVVFDAYGEPTEETGYQISVEPEGAAEEIESGRWSLKEEGLVTFEACALERDLTGRRVCAAKTVVVNDAPPMIELDWPLPGAQLDATNHPVVEVAGTVTDSYGDSFVWVNGAPVEVAGDGTFVHDIEPEFGINHVDVVAADGVRTDESRLAVDFVWGRDYLPASTDAVESVLSDAIRLRLGQRFFDDSVRTGTAPDGTVTTRDVADILELVIREIDFLAQVPNPVVDSGGFTLNLSGISVGKPAIMLDVTDSGLEFFIQITDMNAYTNGSLTVGDSTLDLTGNINAKVAILAVLDVTKENAMEPLDVQVSQLEVAVEDATANFASLEANAIFELAASALRTTLETLLIDTLETAFVNELPALLTDVLSALDTALADQTFDLDTGLGPALTLNLDAGLSNVETRYRDGLYANLDARVSVPDATPAHPETRGTPLLAAQEPLEPFFFEPRMQFALSLAFVNSLLHTLWNAGLLDADISEVLPINTETALLKGRLAPVLRPPRAGETNDFVLEVGQVELTIEFLGDTTTFGVFIGAGVDFGISDGALALQVADEPVIDVWVIETNSDALFITPDTLRDVMLTEVWPSLKDAVADGLSIPLPAPDVGGLATLAPSLQNLMLSFEESRDVEIRDGHLVVDAELVGRLPMTP